MTDNPSFASLASFALMIDSALITQIDPGDNIAKLHRKRAKLRAKGDLRGVSRTEQLLRRQSGSGSISPISSQDV
jgi:hypothetical protein